MLGTSAFIVECLPDTWDRAGFEKMSEAETCEFLTDIFKDVNGGHPILSNNLVKWTNFTLIKNMRWSYENIVL